MFLLLPCRYEYNEFCSPEHLSTHLDAPVHFGFGKWSVSEIPLEHLISQGQFQVIVQDAY